MIISLLGGDILDKYKGMIDYSTKTLKLAENQFSLCYENINDQVESNKKIMESTLTVKARTECVIPIKITNNEKIKHGIVPRTELAPGVLLCPSIITVNNNEGITTILNSTDEDVTFPIPNVNLEEINEVILNKKKYYR